ncbi:diaminopimelate epimerase [Leuconostocaceae bacterium ESL0723]|nr:diaminopimelate epimerase [Leuconostocaceae bacterium ESL0723]
MAKLYKVHGSGNQFFLLDQTELKQPLTDAELVTLGKFVSDPDHQILDGADGLLAVNSSDHPDTLGEMRVINSDGSEASMCGNGLRTVARYLSDKFDKDEFKVATMYADLQVSRQPDLAPDVPAFSVQISPIKFDKAAFPFDNLGHDEIINEFLPELDDHLLFTAIAVPNPHLIAFVKDENDLNETLGKLGKALNEPNPYFPDGVNVNFGKILGDNQLFVRTYERGVGFTNACGTGMSATSLAFAINYPDHVDTDKDIVISNPGGMVKTHLHPDANQPWIDLIGNATVTEVIDVDEQALHQGSFTAADLAIQVTGEQVAYQKFVEGIVSQAQ